MQAMAVVKPTIICCVPMILEKVYRKQVLPLLEKKPMSIAMRIPLLNTAIYSIIRKKLIDAFGGNVDIFIVGGAPMNEETEAFLLKINFPITIGYGMTECGPLISFASHAVFKPTSCGRYLQQHLECKIDSPDPENVAGEIMIRGEHVMMGYYKNEEATQAVFTEDGWFRTGDAGYMKDGFLFLTERIKDLFKTSNGKYIAPQAIETKMVVDRYIDQISIIADERKFVAALIVPDYGLVKQFAEKKGIQYASMAELLKHEEVMELFAERIETLQQQFAHYEQIKKFTLLPEPFSMAKGELTNTLKIKRSVLNKNYAAEIEAMYAEYALNPDITLSRMYYEAISQILPGVKVFINTSTDGDVQMLLPLEPMAETAGGAE